MARQVEEALKVLGIAADSDRERVGLAYRWLARMTHPDVFPDPAAAECFATVTAAYRLVSASSVHPRSTGRAAATSDPARSSRQGVESAYLRAGSWAHPPIVAGPVMVQPVRGDGGAGEA